MSADKRIVDQCEALWRLATNDRKPISSCEADRQSEGTYTNGFRNDIETWIFDQNGFVVSAKKIDWQTFNLAADRNGKRRTLEILQGDKTVFKATQEGSITTKKFGAEERYIGTDHTLESLWRVDEGKVPSELERVPA